MKTTKPTDAFDCIKSKRRAQARIYEKIKDLTPSDEIACFEHAADAGPLANAWRKFRSAKSPRGGM